jgi:hypothetical protein
MSFEDGIQALGRFWAGRVTSRLDIRGIAAVSSRQLQLNFQALQSDCLNT